MLSKYNPTLRWRLSIPILIVIFCFAIAGLQSPAATLAKSSQQTSISGVARVIDGDTLEINGIRVRLKGMDAPERQQSCKNANGASYRCGDAASDVLTSLAAGRQVTCQSDSVDRFRRLLATCAIRGMPDIGLTMIRRGWATVYDGNPAPREYLDAEESAKRQQLGLWRGSFERPSLWRKQLRQDKNQN